MSDKATIEALVNKVMDASASAIASAIEEVVAEAYRAGAESARQRVLAAIGTEPSATGHAAMIVSPPARAVEETGRRAPKGLTKEVVTLILRQNPGGLPLETVQQQAVTFDQRLVEKTVYNELMRGRTKEYRYLMGRWHLAELVPNVRTTDQIGTASGVTTMSS